MFGAVVLLSSILQPHQPYEGSKGNEKIPPELWFLLCHVELKPDWNQRPRITSCMLDVTVIWAKKQPTPARTTIAIFSIRSIHKCILCVRECNFLLTMNKFIGIRWLALHVWCFFEVEMKIAELNHFSTWNCKAFLQHTQIYRERLGLTKQAKRSVYRLPKELISVVSISA